MFCWLIQGPASRNENSRPNLSSGKTQNQVNGHFAYIKIAGSRTGAQTNATSLRNRPDRKGLFWPFWSFIRCIWWPRTAQTEAISETEMLQNTVTGEYCPQCIFIQNANKKIIFLALLWSNHWSLCLSSVSNIIEQFKFNIHGLALLSSQSTCLSLTAGMYQCQLQLPSVTAGVRNFAILPHFPVAPWFVSVHLSCHLMRWPQVNKDHLPGSVMHWNLSPRCS